VKRLTIVRSLTAIAGTAVLTAIVPSVSMAQGSGQAAPPTQTAGKRVISGGGRGSAMLSPGILIGNTLYLSGQLGTAGRDSGVAGETKAAIESARRILQAAEMDLKDVVSVTAFLVDTADYRPFNAAYTSLFTTDPRPTRTTVFVKQLVNNAKVELTMTAVKTP
jgi:enamine deaminase RidA (YjgF/YER057c/UK114 family)